MQNHDLKSLEMIERFIAFDTRNRDSNLPLIHYVRDFLAEFEIESTLTYDDSGQKPTSSLPLARPIARESFCPGIPTSFPWTASRGQPIHST